MFGLPLSYEEPVFRPPSEASSLILQLTVGCSWNRCRFCAMYRDKKFRVRAADEMAAEIQAVAPMVDGVQRVFLADGDALAAPQADLEHVLHEIGRLLPSVQRVGIYGDSRSILKKGVEGLQRLKERGLGIVYFGVESGDEETLHAVNKGATVQRQLAACRTVTEAGMKLSVIVLLGLAGRAGSERHATATGRFLVAASPTFSAALMFTPVPGTELFRAVSDGSFELPDRWGMLSEPM